MRLLLAILITGLAGLAQAVEGVDLDACPFPTAPTVPEGSTASTEDLNTAGKSIREYVADMEAALACLDEIQGGLGEEITQEQSAAITERYNAGVDEMNGLAESFNEQVRAFKAKQGQ